MTSYNFMADLAQVESNSMNIYSGVDPDVPGWGVNSRSQGYYQINTPTWHEFAPSAGVDLSKYPNAISAPANVQTQVAALIPMGRFGPRTQTLMADKYGALSGGVTVGAYNQKFGGLTPSLGTQNAVAAGGPSTDLAAQSTGLQASNDFPVSDYAPAPQPVNSAAQQAIAANFPVPTGSLTAPQPTSLPFDNTPNMAAAAAERAVPHLQQADWKRQGIPFGASLYPSAQTAVASLAAPQPASPLPGVTALAPVVAQALGFSGFGGVLPSPLSSAAIQATINPSPYTTQAYVPPSMGFNDPNNFGPDLRTLNNAAFNSVTGPANVPTAFQSAQAADPTFAGSRYDPISGGAPGAPSLPAATFTDPGAGTFAGGYGGNASATPPVAPPAGSGQPASSLYSGAPAVASPAMGAGAASGLQSYQLPLSNTQYPGQITPTGVVDPMAAAAAAPPAAAASPPPLVHAQVAGGNPIMNAIYTGLSAIAATPFGQKVTAALANPGSLTGITGFGNGPLPSGVTDKSSFSNWLGSQQWQNPSLYNANGSVNPSGGSAYQYFAPSSPGGIGGYVANGQVFTYPTTNTQDFFHTAGN